MASKKQFVRSYDSMDNRLTINDIETAINQIVDTVGISASIESSSFIEKLDNFEIAPCIKDMAQYLGLPIKINLSYVTAKATSSSNRFHSTGMSKVNSTGESSDGIIAQVNIPDNLPLYGSLKLNNYPIEVHLTSSILYNNDVFIGVMAHELSHVVLHSLQHPKRENEFFTDLTAMILGFSILMGKGRVTKETTIADNIKTVHTRKYGYLSDSQFNYALQRTSQILSLKQAENKNVIRQAKKLHNLCNRYNNKLNRSQKIY